MSTGCAYGLRLTGLPPSALITEGAPEAWSLWRVAHEEDDGAAPADVAIGAASARVPVRPQGALEIDRRAASIAYRTSEPLSDEALVHPYLAPAAAIIASWAGRISFHGAAFVVRGGAWLVLADSAAGKSALMAALAVRGVTILADDLLVVDRDAVMAGPRCLDLRGDAAEYLGLGSPLGVIGARERWRVPLRPAPPALAIGGFITLGWAQRPAVEFQPASARLPELMRHRAVLRGTVDAAPCLELAALPMLQFSRPRRLAELENGVDVLLGALTRDQAAADVASPAS